MVTVLIQVKQIQHTLEAEPLSLYRAMTRSCRHTAERTSEEPDTGGKWSVRTTEWKLEGCTTWRGRMLMDGERGEAKAGKLWVCTHTDTHRLVITETLWQLWTALTSFHLNSLSHSLSHLQCFLNGRVNVGGLRLIVGGCYSLLCLKLYYVTFPRV